MEIVSRIGKRKINEKYLRPLLSQRYILTLSIFPGKEQEKKIENFLRQFMKQIFGCDSFPVTIGGKPFISYQYRLAIIISTNRPPVQHSRVGWSFGSFKKEF